MRLKKTVKRFYENAPHDTEIIVRPKSRLPSSVMGIFLGPRPSKATTDYLWSPPANSLWSPELKRFIVLSSFRRFRRVCRRIMLAAMKTARRV
jgi:hypothetical protein